MTSQSPASEKSVQLLSGVDLLAAGRAQITQGLAAESSGAILYPDQILSVSAAAALKDTPQDPRIAEWSKVYRFIVVPFSIAVQPKPGTAPKNLVINAAFRNTGQTSKQPIIIDIFPSTAFKADPLTANASVGLGADLKFAGALAVNADASVKAALSYSYAPAFANVQTGYSSSACFWQFLATQAEQPVGSLPLKLTVAVPLAVSAQSVALNFDVVASFGGYWFGDDVRASFLAEVLLPKP